MDILLLLLYLECILVIRIVSIHQHYEARGIGHVSDDLPSFPFILLVRVDAEEVSFLRVGRMMRDFVGTKWLVVMMIIVMVIIVVMIIVMIMGVHWCCRRSLHCSKPSSITKVTIHQYRWYTIQHIAAWSSTSNPPCSIRIQHHSWCSHHFKH